VSITGTAPFKAQNTFAYSDSGIMDLNPSLGMDVCDLSLFALFYVDSGLATVDHM
jgi:hypothetical protein